MKYEWKCVVFHWGFQRKDEVLHRSKKVSVGTITNEMKEYMMVEWQIYKGLLTKLYWGACIFYI